MKKVAFCVDSDGCAMDTMTYKHELFFGPLAADIYEVEDREQFLQNWNEINLYSKTRGVNRFIGLVLALDSVDYAHDYSELKQWVDETPSLSNAALEEVIAETDSDQLKKALKWSEAVNKGASEAEGHDKPFPGAREGLAHMEELGDVYVVSSANPEAIQDEWTRHGLLEHVTEVYAQDRGSKTDALADLRQKGYEAENILMVGDSPGDLEAAEKNDVWFFPILVGKEAHSWDKLNSEVAQKLADGNFGRADHEAYVQAFWHNLDGDK